MSKKKNSLSDNTVSGTLSVGETLLRRYAQPTADTEYEETHNPGCSCCLGEKR